MKHRITPPLWIISALFIALSAFVSLPLSVFFTQTALADQVIPNEGDDGNAHWTWDGATKTITVTAKDNTDGVMIQSSLPVREKGGHINFDTYSNDYSWRIYHLPEAKHIKFVQNAQGTPVTIQIKDPKDNEIIPQRFFGEDTKKIGTFRENTCKAEQLKTADLTGLKFDVSAMAQDQVMVYNNFFGNCENLEEVILSEYPFGNDHLKAYYQMFINCNKLKHIYGATYDKQTNSWTIDKSEDTSGVKYLNDTNCISVVAMFRDCKSLASFNASLFPNKLKLKLYNSAAYAWYMFKNCTGLTSLNLTGVTLENATDMEGMFANCSQVPTFDLKSFNTAKCTTMKYMFFHCGTAKELDLSSFDTSNVTDMTGMFQHSNCLEKIVFSKKFDTKNVKTMESMFSGVVDESPSAPKAGNFALKSLDLSTFNTKNCTNFNNMFSGLRMLETLKFGENFATNGNNQAMKDTFAGDTALKELTVGKPFEFKYDCALPEPNFGKAKWTRKGASFGSFSWTSKQLVGHDNVASIYTPNAAADGEKIVMPGTIVTTPNLRKMTFNLDGGKLADVDSYKPCAENTFKHETQKLEWFVPEGTTIAKPTNPNRDGYTFAGWVARLNNAENPVLSSYDLIWKFADAADAASVVNGDLDLKAQWNKNEGTGTDNPETSDSGTQTDTSTGTDTGTQTDNTSTGTDTGTQTDNTGTGTDIGTDTGTGTDTSTSVDTGTQTDTTTSVDTGTQTDNNASHVDTPSQPESNNTRCANANDNTCDHKDESANTNNDVQIGQKDLPKTGDDLFGTTPWTGYVLLSLALGAYAVSSAVRAYQQR